MYDSAPRNREGEPIEQIVPEAIRTTASASDAARGAARARDRLHSGESPPRGRGPAFVVAATVGALEAVALIVLLAGWGPC